MSERIHIDEFLLNNITTCIELPDIRKKSYLLKLNALFENAAKQFHKYLFIKILRFNVLSKIDEMHF